MSLWNLEIEQLPGSSFRNFKFVGRKSAAVEPFVFELESYVSVHGHELRQSSLHFYIPSGPQLCPSTTRTPETLGNAFPLPSPAEKHGASVAFPPPQTAHRPAHCHPAAPLCFPVTRWRETFEPSLSPCETSLTRRDATPPCVAARQEVVRQKGCPGPVPHQECREEGKARKPAH
ncbi:MAG: hypothetical protein BJ554DRAFT_7261 [Olpidium bornovanus]|uniref:Uncharacterized protein n=1 Tax=Olpidium bornovanus TaxID=278681 RepID=A0A8H8DJE7_9FUNG|nr:MAG: hypothetical protein BJ554DRAFT_7261 [Olpidium bornovanus]